MCMYIVSRAQTHTAVLKAGHPSLLFICACMFVLLYYWCGGSGFPFFSSSTTNLGSVLYTCTWKMCIHMYMYMYIHVFSCTCMYLDTLMPLYKIIVQVASSAHLCQSVLSSPLLQTLSQSFLLLFTHIQRNHLLHRELTATLRENNGREGGGGRGNGRDGGWGDEVVMEGERGRGERG